MRVKQILLSKIYCISILFMVITSCERRSLTECIDASYVLMPVKIDWSLAGFPETASSKDPNDYVHRVSIRFFPKSGGEAFDRYLETNITTGEIMVPVGEYSVIVFNESVYDVSWNDIIRFTDINNYYSFAANTVEIKNDQTYFAIDKSEPLIAEPPRLVSWSLSDLNVKASTADQSNQNDALTKIVMQPLTYDIHILAHVENLKNAQLMMGHKRGFAAKVYMASRQTDQIASSYLFKFNGRKWYDQQKTSGTTEMTFRSFGKVTEKEKRYFVDTHIVLTNGQLYIPSTPLLFDVTDQVQGAEFASKGEPNKISIVLHDIMLPEVKDGIHVGEWDDDNEHIIIK